MIRPMEIKDVASVYDIDLLTLKSNWSENLYRYELLDINTRAYVYELDEKVIGFVVAKYIGHTSDLLQIAVDPFYKHKKIGAALMVHLLESLKKEGVLEMFLEVSVKNTDVIGFYRKFNFKTVNVRKNYYGRGNDAILMKLKVR